MSTMTDSIVESLEAAWDAVASQFSAGAVSSPTTPCPYAREQGEGAGGGAKAAPKAASPLDSPEVKKEMKKAWEDSKAGDKDKRHEEGGYIVKNADGTYGVERWKNGGQAAIAPPPRDKDGKYNGKEVVGEFHTHPNPNVDESGKKWKEGPSDGDLSGIKDEKYPGDSYVIGHENVYKVDKDGNDKGKVGKREEVLK